MKKLNIFAGLKDFLILWASQTVSVLGTAMTELALILWVYGQNGTATSVAILTMCLFLPTIFLRFIGGAFVDRRNKKRVIIIADMIAACGTAVILLLYMLSALEIWHLYIINVLLSIDDAFQVPASDVAVSLLAPKEQYERVSAIQSFGGSAVSITVPALTGVLTAYGGLAAVLIIDLVSFAIAVITLLFLVKIPETKHAPKEVRQPFTKDLTEGVRFLKEHKALLYFILIITVLNFLAKFGPNGMQSVYLLSRTGGDETAVGMVGSAGAIGGIIASVIAVLTKPAKNRIGRFFLSWGAVSLICGVGMGLARNLPLWIAVSLAASVPAVMVGANLSAIMRSNVPLEMQGRVFSAQSTLQNCSLPLAILLSGILADNVFEPFMTSESPVQQLLAALFGTGKGSGIALMFFISGVLSVIICTAALKVKLFRRL